MATQLQDTQLAATDRATAVSLEILATLTQGYTDNFTVRLWNGVAWQPNSGPAPFTLVLNHPGALRVMLWPPQAVNFGESYLFDDFDIEGDIFAFTRWLKHLVDNGERHSFWFRLKMFRRLLKLPRQVNTRDAQLAGKPTKGDHRIVRDREAIAFTYDLPVEFYRLFLDDNMQYTCGYFASADDDLNAAQSRKMDYICRKLRLKPGERFADFGCGWGGLLIHAAKTYGVEGVGFTLSHVQAEHARRAIAEAGLEGRVRIELCDYREFHPERPFDKATSVGMGEHIGHKNLPVFFRKVYEVLKPGGIYLHHTLNIAPNTQMPRWTAFSHKYVFPNGEMQNILFVLTTAANAGFEIRDVENLREHYALTLDRWVRKLEANRAKVIALVGEVRYRVFRLYMSGAILGFRAGIYNLTHSLVVKPDKGRTGLELTRADWYA
ncbi:MAG: cyclopropane-fatty-acyl-phospholipid synthase family protein [Gemmataceae bacterium]|nr:cyclopropane-fatty-acyl-phospholipid synthase family protein [Gemmataceae bacterium]